MDKAHTRTQIRTPRFANLHENGGNTHEDGFSKEEKPKLRLRLNLSTRVYLLEI